MYLFFTHNASLNNFFKYKNVVHFFHPNLLVIHCFSVVRYLISNVYVIKKKLIFLFYFKEFPEVLP